MWKPDQIQTFLMSIQHDRFAALFLLELTTGIRRARFAVSSGQPSTSMPARSLSTTIASSSKATRGTNKVAKQRTPTRRSRSIGPQLQRCATGAWSFQNHEREFFGPDYHPGDFVFTFEDGRPPHPDTIRRRFDRLAAAAGLSRITFHDLRHSYATGALKAGISPKVISERIGHANVGFFLETYAHVLRNDDRDAAEQAAAFLIGDGWDPADEGDRLDD